jgi:hypothetical protein
METANQLLRDWRDINRARGGKTARPASTASKHPQRPSTGSAASDSPVAQLSGQMGGMRLSGAESQPGEGMYGGRQQTMSPPLGLPQDPRQSMRPPPGAGPPVPPGYPHSQGLPARPGQGYEAPLPTGPDGHSGAIHEVGYFTS